MGYYVRVLSTSADCIPLAELQSTLENSKMAATISLERGTPEKWAQVILKHADGSEIAVIERDLVEADSLGAEELAEFNDEIADCKPVSAVGWLRHYFARIRCTYACQLLSGTDHQDGWKIFGVIKNRIWAFAPSIIQADAEGFSNEEGYHILWQFGDSAKGPWWMGVLRDSEWVHFQMDLGNCQHREAFFRGEIPDGVRLAT